MTTIENSRTLTSALNASENTPCWLTTYRPPANPASAPEIANAEQLHPRGVDGRRLGRHLVVADGDDRPARSGSGADSHREHRDDERGEAEVVHAASRWPSGDATPQHRPLRCVFSMNHGK